MQTHLSTLSAIVLATTVSLTLLTACGGSSSETNNVSSKLDGIWEHTGYGDVYEINNSGGIAYQYTRATCLKIDEFDHEDLQDIFGNGTISPDRTTLEMGSENSSFIDRYHRLENLPETCLGKGLITSTSALTTFQHLWHTFNDYYAFFNERHVDWEARYQQFSGLISDDMDDDLLFSVLANLLSPLDDAHVKLNSDNNAYTPMQAKGANRVVIEAFSQQSDYNDLDTFASLLSDQYAENLQTYLDPQSIKTIDGLYPEIATWGTINTSVGYLQIASMAFFSPQDEGLNISANLQAVHAFMPQVIADLEDTQAMIIDVRFNGGGHDEVSLAIASYFADQRRKVLSKTARYWLGETPSVEAFIEPVNTASYLKPVIVIGGGNSTSAAEIFLICMNALPHVTLLGENSSGALSDSLDKVLPNGWHFSLSNEVYLDAAGNSHEGSGVPPQITAPVFSLEAITSGRNAAIDAALQAIGIL